VGNALRPAKTSALVLGAATDLVRSKPELVAENALLRQQLIVLARSTKRARISRSDRALLVLLVSRVRTWRQALLIVQPATLLRWHRAGFRVLSRWRSAPRSNQARVSPETVALIRRMAQEDRLRDAERIRASCSSWASPSASARSSGACAGPGRRAPSARPGPPSYAPTAARSGRASSCS
jgi:hypothetical protein